MVTSNEVLASPALGRSLTGARVDGRLSALAGVYLQVVTCAGTFMMPVAVDALTPQFKMTPAQIGYLSAAILGTSTISNIAAAALTSRIRWALNSLIYCAIMTVGSFCTAFSGNFALLLIWSVISSFGNGVVTSVTASALGVSQNPQRNFGLMCLVTNIYAIASLFVSPFLVSRFGWGSIFVLSAIITLPGVYLSVWLPQRTPEYSGKYNTNGNRITYLLSQDLSLYKRILGISVVFIIFAAMMIMFTYTGRYAEKFGISSDVTSFCLSGSFLFSILGSLISTRITRMNNHVGVFLGILCVLIGLVCFIGMSSGVSPLFVFVTGLSVFMFGWSFGQTFILAAAAGADSSGAAAAMVTGVTTFGTALGPALIAPAVERFGLVAVPYGAVVLLALATVLGLAFVRRTGR